MTFKSEFSSSFWWTFPRWQIGRYEPLWVIDSIINSLVAIPTLRGINLNHLKYSYRIGKLSAFSNLHKIRVQATHVSSDRVILELGKVLAQCPALTDLDISLYGDMSQLFQFVNHAGKPLALHHLSMDQGTVSPHFFKSAIQHFRSLQSLHLYRCSSRLRCWVRPLHLGYLDQRKDLYPKPIDGWWERLAPSLSVLFRRVAKVAPRLEDMIGRRPSILPTFCRPWFFTTLNSTYWSIQTGR